MFWKANTYVEPIIDMGRSSLVFLCCIHLLLLDKTFANTGLKTITIYGLEQGSQLKISKHPANRYILQAGAFNNQINAIKYKEQITSKTNIPVRVISSNKVQIRYHVILGPFADAQTLINVSRQLLSKKSPTLPSSPDIINLFPFDLTRHAQSNNRLLSNLAAEREEREDTQRRTAVYTPVHEDSSTVSMKQFSPTVEFRKKSNQSLFSAPVLSMRFSPNTYKMPIRKTVAYSTSSILLAESADMKVEVNLPSRTESPDEVISFDKVKINLTHYDPKTFLLAYDVFIMNGNVEFAFKVATVAVKHEPTSIQWRKKLAEVSLWSGNAAVALEQWMYFIKNNIHPEEYIDKALVLAKQLDDYDAQATLLHRQLQKSPNNKLLLLKYNEALQNQGYPDKALSMLQEIPNVENDRQYLEQLVAITKGVDNPNLQLHYLHRLSILDPLNIKPKLNQAELLYSQGNLADAYQIYHSAATELAPDDVKFWRDYANISLASGNYHSAISAYKRLLNTGVIDKSSAINLVNLEQQDGQTIAAYRDAQIAYRKYHDISLIKLILSLGATLDKWQEVKRFIDTLSPREVAKLKSNPEYAMLIAMAYRRVGLIIEAYQEWEWIFRRWPNLTSVQRTYLWFLVDNDEIRQLEYILKQWCKIFGLKVELWDVYASALTNIGDYSRALAVMQQHHDEVNQNYSMLLNIADLFMQNNNSYAAYYLQRRAFYLLMNEIVQQPNEGVSLTQRLALAELMQIFAPASATYNVIVNLSAQLFHQPEVDNQILAWALENKNYALASYITKIHKIYGIHTPPWMQLTLALEENDRDLMQLLLLDSPKLLPYRDRVTAAVRTGNITLAEEYAYQGLKEHPQDSEMYDLFTETMLPRANQFSASLAQQTWGNVKGPLMKLSTRVFITPSLALTPYGMIWFPRTDDTAIFATTPSVDRTTGIRARQFIERGWWETGLAERKSLDNVFSIVTKWHRDDILLPRLNADLSLSYHNKAEETTSLLLGGMKNEAKLALNYNWDSYNFFDGEAGLQQFLGQEGFHLGTGQELRLHWQHKFYLSYPDWNINLYNSWLNYQSTNNPLPLALQQFIPAGQDPSISFYMPVNDIDGAITFGFGQQYKEEYTHNWKPFAEAGLILSKAFGFGQIAQGGIASSIFGRDHLVLYFEYTVNQQQVNQQQINQRQAAQTFYTIGMSYDYYF